MENKKGFNRRDFLKIVGVTTGAAATGCAKELPEKIIPYVVQPDEVIPGVATWYAASCNECESHCGTLIRTREGRAVKVEGNPEHPISKGGLCARGQSSIQGHYDPDRIREPLMRAANGAFKPVTWKEALDALAEALSASEKNALITSPETGSLESLLGDFSKKIENTDHYQYSLLGRMKLDDSVSKVFGPNLQATYDFSKADVILNLGADFLGTWVSPVEFTKGFSSQRVPGKNGEISKFYHIEPRLSQTAANSDKWIANAAGSDERVLLAVASKVLEKKSSGQAASSLKSMLSGFSVDDLLKDSGVKKTDVEKIASELVAANNPVVLAGGSESLVISHLLNSLLGSVGSTLVLQKKTSSKAKDFYEMLSNKEKDSKEKESSYGVVMFSGINPVYSMPAKSEVAQVLSKASTLVAVSSQLDATTSLANIVFPLSSSFETWADSESQPGVFGLSQPSMSPLYESMSLGDVLIAVLAHEKIDKPISDVSSFEDYMKLQWKKRTGDSNFKTRWMKYVQNGGDWSNASTKGVSVDAKKVSISKDSLSKTDTKKINVVVFPTVHFGDGRAANRPWAQEIPDPMTTAIWGSWLEIHPELAEAKGLKHGKLAQLVFDGGSIEAPVYVTKNIHPNTVAVPLGQGHTELGRFANGVGANPLHILPAATSVASASFLGAGVEVRKSHASEELVTTQGNDSQLERGFLRTVSKETLKKGSDSHAAVNGGGHGAHGGEHGEGHDTHGLEFHHHDLHALGPQKEPKQMYKQMDHVQYKWGMSIDLAKCTGCSACVTACYAENNIAVVGKEFAAQGREMAWIRISRYLDGDDDQPVTGFQPMMCQHCGNAPCEPVCPVYATYHSDEGLNTMVYNRCVGTRYCSNNCSYKVRRFNWFDYDWPEPLNWQLNPDVTVRTVGIMEKCSFCIQRIKEVENIAKNEGRHVKDGELQPACAATCPADAISFGNLKDKKSVVAEDSQSERSYRVLHAELNTQPAVTYLAKITHEDKKKHAHDDHETHKDEHHGEKHRSDDHHASKLSANKGVGNV